MQGSPFPSLSGEQQVTLRSAPHHVGGVLTVQEAELLQVQINDVLVKYVPNTAWDRFILIPNTMWDIRTLKK